MWYIKETVNAYEIEARKLNSPLQLLLVKNTCFSMKKLFFLARILKSLI